MYKDATSDTNQQNTFKSVSDINAHKGNNDIVKNLVSRYVTRTLAMTTMGDQRVRRANGMNFSDQAKVVSGVPQAPPSASAKGCMFASQNQLLVFRPRDMIRRKFFRPTRNNLGSTSDVYGGSYGYTLSSTSTDDRINGMRNHEDVFQGDYTSQMLEKVEKYDAKLLSDTERRLKRFSILSS